MMADSDRPGVDVPGPDWNEQLIDALEPVGGSDEGVESVLGSSVIREVDDSDVAGQELVVDFDDDDGYESSGAV